MCRRSACCLSTLAICPSSSWRRAICPRPVPNSARASAATESTTSRRTAWSMSASSNPLSRCSVSESVDGVKTRIFSVKDRNAFAFALVVCSVSFAETPYAEGNTFAAISATRAPENFCSVSTYTTRQPLNAAGARPHGEREAELRLARAGGPTSSVMDPAGNAAAQSRVQREERAVTTTLDRAAALSRGVDAEEAGLRGIRRRARGPAGPPRAPAAVCAPTRLVPPARSWAWAHVPRRTPPRAPPRAARCPEPTSPARSASARPSRCGSCGPPAWTGSTFRPATRASERCFAAIAKKRDDQPGPPLGPRHPRRAFELTSGRRGDLLKSLFALKHRDARLDFFGPLTRSFLGVVNESIAQRGRARRGSPSRTSPEPRRRRGAASFARRRVVRTLGVAGVATGRTARDRRPR